MDSALPGSSERGCGAARAHLAPLSRAAHSRKDTRRLLVRCPPTCRMTSGCRAAHTGPPSATSSWAASNWSMWCTTSVSGRSACRRQRMAAEAKLRLPPTRRPLSTSATNGQRSACPSAATAATSSSEHSSPATIRPRWAPDIISRSTLSSEVVFTVSRPELRAGRVTSSVKGVPLRSHCDSPESTASGCHAACEGASGSRNWKLRCTGPGLSP
mmetsp:Transcript_37113/g.104759  ORF Transcript_37113/g.104759 Transcript_37113/m.104759 type:complete len:214 (-) Transcript_37113:1382-2023(-)